MISLDDARVLLLAGVTPSETETVALADCSGRVLAADVIAGFDQPALPVSAMDGYAIRSADAVAGARLKLIGTAYAGAPFAGVVVPGAAVRIATGGVVPSGAERIVVQEIVTRDGDELAIGGPLPDETFIRPAGGDFHAGDVLLAAGDRLRPARLGLAAAANHASLAVRRRPRVTIFASGDELREPGAAIGPGEVVNSAAYALEALIERWGGAARREAILPDDRARCADLIDAARHDADLLVFIGGASVGDRDVLRQVVGDLGATLSFDRIAVQPGKPSWHARFADGPLILGLPGNPASAFVCAHLLLEPLLAALLGGESRTATQAATLKEAMPAGGPRETYWRATAAIDASGRQVVLADSRRDSSLQVPLAGANALIKRPASTGASAAGDRVDIIVL